jgi:hypothetical protein
MEDARRRTKRDEDVAVQMAVSGLANLKPITFSVL